MPDIANATARFRLLTALVVLGGWCRLLGVALGDALTPPVAAALLMELIVTPLLCLWQGRVARRASPPPAEPVRPAFS